MAGVAANVHLSPPSVFLWLDSFSMYQVDTIRSKNQKTNGSDHVTLTCKMQKSFAPCLFLFGIFY